MGFSIFKLDYLRQAYVFISSVGNLYLANLGSHYLKAAGGGGGAGRVPDRPEKEIKNGPFRMEGALFYLQFFSLLFCLLV